MLVLGTGVELGCPLAVVASSAKYASTTHNCGSEQFESDSGRCNGPQPHLPLLVRTSPSRGSAVSSRNTKCILGFVEDFVERKASHPDAEAQDGADRDLPVDVGEFSRCYSQLSGVAVVVCSTIAPLLVAR